MPNETRVARPPMAVSTGNRPSTITATSRPAPSPHIFLTRAQMGPKKKPGQDQPCLTASLLPSGYSKILNSFISSLLLAPTTCSKQHWYQSRYRTAFNSALPCPQVKAVIPCSSEDSTTIASAPQAQASAWALLIAAEALLSCPSVVPVRELSMQATS